VRSGDRFIFYYSDSDSVTPPADGAWIAHGSAQMVNMTDEVHVGLFNVSGDENVDTSRFDNFHLCLKGTEGTPPGEDFPPGLVVCTGNLIQNSGFEDPSGANWNNYGDLSATNPAHDPADPNYPFEGQRNARMATFEDGFGWFQPKLGQTFTMPDWITSTTTMNLSLYSCVTDFGTPEANDRLSVALRSLTPTLISTQELVADGGTSNTVCSAGDYQHYTLDLADAIEAAGGNLENGDVYEEQTFELYFENTSNSSCSGSISDPNCYESRFYLDKVELEVCTEQPPPDSHPDPGKATIEGALRVFLSGAPTEKQGVRVWTYQENGDLLTTYSLHDSTYHFYNIDPGTYTIYSEYWDGPNLYSTFARVSVGPDETANRSLLLR
jgi:hypothetical protein